MDWVPQASGVFIFRVQLVVQVIPGIKGYDWIAAASLPLVQGLTPPAPWMKTYRKLCSPVWQLLHSPLSCRGCPPVVFAKGKIFLSFQFWFVARVMMISHQILLRDSTLCGFCKARPCQDFHFKDSTYHLTPNLNPHLSENWVLVTVCSHY